MQKNTLPPQGSRPSDTPPSNKPLQTPLKDYEKTLPIDLVNQCRYRLILLSSFIMGEGNADEGHDLTPVMVDALYFSLISIQDDLERAIDGMRE